MFSILLLLIAIVPQGGISSVEVQGSYAQVQSNVQVLEVQTQDLRAVNSHGQADGLKVEPVNNLTLNPTVAH